MNRLITASRCHSMKTLYNNYGLCSPLLLAPKKTLQENVFFRGLHDQKGKIRSTLNYMVALGVMTVGLSYAAVPLYRIFCQVSITLFCQQYKALLQFEPSCVVAGKITKLSLPIQINYFIKCSFQAYSYGGTTGLVEANNIVGDMKAVKSRPLKIRFNADTASSMQWNFKPQQLDITVRIFLKTC